MSERILRINKVLREFNISLERAIDFFKSNGIVVEANPNAKISIVEYEVLSRQFAPKDKAPTLSPPQKVIKNDKKLFTPGNVVKARISKIIAPSQIITEYVGGYHGRLSLLDISWTIPQAEQIFRKYKIGDDIDCAIFSVNEKNKQVILTQKHLAKPFSQTVKWDRLERGEEFEVEIFQELNSLYIVQTKDKFFGIVRKNLLSDHPQKMRFKINSKLEDSNLLDFIPSEFEQEFSTYNIQPDKEYLNFIEEDLQSFTKFKKSILGQNSSDDQLELIQRGFEADNNIFSKEIDTGHVLYVQFLVNDASYENNFKNQAIPYFLNGEVHSDTNEKNLFEKLSTEKYWFRINRRDKSDNKNPNEKKQIIEFSMYNDEVNFFGEINQVKNDVRFTVKNFSFGQSFSFATNAKKNYAKYGSFLFSNTLKVVPPLAPIPFDTSQKEILDYSLLKLDCFELVEKLKLDTGEILRQEGRTLAIIDKFLEYQTSLLTAEKENTLFVPSFEKVNSPSGKISIKLPVAIGDKLLLEEGTVLNVRLQDKDKISKLSDGFITIVEDNYILNFNRDILLTLLANGFYLDKRVSTKQFDIQREIIKDFLEKKIKIDHIESLLVNPSKIKTPTVKDIAFINADLTRTELEQPNNTQIRAVKKAIGNQNIFLIQGPPGTGKTTVIAEIIEQLTSKNEKILVSGQNHVAVDNVLEKISKNPNLNLLRVGNPERIDTNLLRYCYDNLVQEYRIDYKSFVKNQLFLAKEYLELKTSKVEQKLIQKIFNDKVNGLISDYIYLGKTFKEKHFVLRDSLDQLSENELHALIEVLSNWENSFNNEFEILLKPIIYNTVDVVFATCIGIKGDIVFKENKFKFDTVIIDEAGRANIAETLVAIELGKKVILVGDQLQLPPYMDSSLIDKDDPNSFPNSTYGKDYFQDEISHALKTSFFEFLIKRIDIDQFPSQNKEMLNYQHRMHPNIGNFVSECFYGSKVFMGSRTHLNTISLPVPFDKEIVFFDTSNSKNPFESKEGLSIKNDTEAEIVTEFILPKLIENNVNPGNVAVIAPYKSQVANIKEYLNKSTSLKNITIDVATLDSFQGKEYDVIIFSFTRSTNHKAVKSINGKKQYLKVGFLDDAKRLNVAFSRAKKKLILVGNALSLTDPKSHFDLLFDYTNLFKKLVSLSKSEQIGNFINIADYHDSCSPFQKIFNKYKKGDSVRCRFKSLGMNKEVFFGAFFYIENLECLLPVSFMSSTFRNEVKLYDVDREIDLTIFEIDEKNSRITLNFPPIIKTLQKPFKNVLRKPWDSVQNEFIVGKKIKGKVITKLEYGFLISLDHGYKGLLLNRQIPQGMQVELLASIDVKIQKVDQAKQQISLKL